MLTPYGRFMGAIGGTIVVAICCFTPVLVIALTAIGLGAMIRYLDYVLTGRSCRKSTFTGTTCGTKAPAGSFRTASISGSFN